jgi:hypothetical protein
MYSKRGMGQTSGQIANIAAKGAATTASLLATLGVVSNPIGAAIGGIAAVGALIANMFHGCGDTCVVASRNADAAEQALQQNLQSYFSAPAPRYASIQAAALNNVDTLFQALYQACSDPSLGDAGKRCISERLVRGGTAPWCPNAGHTGCDWYVLYRDPIANDQNVIPDPTVTGEVSSAFSSLIPSAGLGGWLIPGALVLGGAFFLLAGSKN